MKKDKNPLDPSKKNERSSCFGNRTRRGSPEKRTMPIPFPPASIGTVGRSIFKQILPPQELAKETSERGPWANGDAEKARVTNDKAANDKIHRTRRRQVLKGENGVLLLHTGEFPHPASREGVRAYSLPSSSLGTPQCLLGCDSRSCRSILPPPDRIPAGQRPMQNSPGWLEWVQEGTGHQRQSRQRQDPPDLDRVADHGS